MDNLVELVKAVLTTTPARWKSLADKVPAELLNRRPLPEEWSAVECLQHLIDAEQAEEHAFPVRVRAFLNGEVIADFDPDKEKRQTGVAETPAELASRFAALRKANLKLLDKLSSTDLQRSTVHSTLGTVTLGEMLHQWAGHDLMHTVQAERAIMQPFIAGTGPWRSFFADHDVGAKSN